jgi:hypothetical protein
MTLFAILMKETQVFVKVAVPSKIPIKRLVWLVVQIIYQLQVLATVLRNVHMHRQM